MSVYFSLLPSFTTEADFFFPFYFPKKKKEKSTDGKTPKKKLFFKPGTPKNGHAHARGPAKKICPGVTTKNNIFYCSNFF